MGGPGDTGLRQQARRLTADRHSRLARLWSNEELARIGPLFKGAVVNVSGWEDSDKEGGHYATYFPNATSYAVTNFSGDRGFQGKEGELFLDLTAPSPDDLRGRFDVVFNHTTLEHVFEVGQAFRTLCELSRDVVVVVVPFSQLQHETESYGDFWRFTPSALRALFTDNGFAVGYESISTHRNAAIYLLFVGTRHPDRWQGVLPFYRPIDTAGHWIGNRPFRRLARPLLQLRDRVAGVLP